MENKTYDIFISYRRLGGAQYARILQLMLQQRGYHVFLDYDELTDGVFGDHIKSAIKDAPVFMLVLSEKSMERCMNEDDWVRQEILLAIQEKKHIIPVNPDNSFDGFPNDTSDKHFPDKIRNYISSHQYSDIGFGQTLGVTIDLMIKNRIVPTLGKRQLTEHVDFDFQTAQKTLEKQDAHNRFVKRLTVTGVIMVVVITLATCLWFIQNQRLKVADEPRMSTQEHLRVELQEKYEGFGLQLSPDLTREQMYTIDTLLMNMSPVYPDSIWMSQFEFTVGQWYGIKGEPYDMNQKYLPKVNVSLGDITMLLIDLQDMTNLMVELPSVEVWEYAAHGGPYKETTLFVGSNDPDSVAWYKENSEGHAHASNGQQNKGPNMLDLYDMSGNVSELCMSAFLRHTDNSPFTICGGNYNSPASGITVSSRAPFANNGKADTVGFRIIIRKL